MHLLETPLVFFKVQIQLPFSKNIYFPYLYFDHCAIVFEGIWIEELLVLSLATTERDDTLLSLQSNRSHN